MSSFSYVLLPKTPKPHFDGIKFIFQKFLQYIQLVGKLLFLGILNLSGYHKVLFPVLTLQC